jgi:tetratricopeptide (TPR) repeat protein
MDEAIPLLESVISRAPRFYPAYSELVDAYRHEHALEKAEAYFAGLLRDPERSAFAHYALGRIADSSLSSGEAADHYAACVQQMPDSVPCYGPLAFSLVNSTRRSATVEDLASRIPGDRENSYDCLAFTQFFLAKRKIQEALEAAQRCLERAEALGQIDFLVAAHDLIVEGYDADHDAQLAHRMEAARLAAQLGDPEAAFGHRLIVCGVYANLDRSAEAQECFERALTEAHAQGNRSWLEFSLVGSADAHMSSGQLDEAIAQFSEAVDLEQKDGQLQGSAPNLLEIGKIHFVKGDLPASRRFCEEALTDARAHGSRIQEAFALRELSKVYSVSGDPNLALRYANESIAIFRDVGLDWQAGAGVGNLPEIYAFMGDWPSALRYAEESLQSAKNAEDILEQQDASAIKGDVLLGMGRYLEAAQSYRESLALDSSTKFAPFRLAGLMGLGGAYLGLKEYGHAEERLRNALELARQLGNRRAEANALAQLGRCYRQFGSLEKTREYFGKALEIAASIPLVEVTLVAQRGMAELAKHAGDYRRALEHLQSAAENVESLRAHIPTTDLKADFGRENAKLYEDLLYVLAQLHRREPGKGWDRAAFEFAERGRARAFLDLLGESRTQITKGLSVEQVRQQGELEAALSRAMSALVERDSTANRHAADLAERNLNDWNTAARVTNPQYEALRYPQPINASQAGGLTSSFGGTIFEYALGDHESYLWAVTPGRVQFFRLPRRAVVEGAVRSYRNLISHSPKGAQFDAWQAGAADLYNMLVKPAQALLAPGRPLVIVPDGILHYLPFETLRAAGPNGLPECLIERYPVSYMPSISVLAELEQGAPDRPRKFDLLV